MDNSEQANVKKPTPSYNHDDDSDINKTDGHLVTSKQVEPSALLNRISNFLPTIQAANLALETTDQSTFQIDVQVDNDDDDSSSDSDDDGDGDDSGDAVDNNKNDGTGDNREIEMTIAMGELDETTTNILSSNVEDTNSGQLTEELEKPSCNDSLLDNEETDTDWKQSTLRFVDRKENDDRETEHIRAISSKPVKRKKVLIEEIGS